MAVTPKGRFARGNLDDGGFAGGLRRDEGEFGSRRGVFFSGVTHSN